MRHDQQSDAPEGRDELPKSLELLARKLGADAGDTSDVASRPPQAHHESATDWVSSRRHDDRDRTRRVFRRKHRGRLEGDDDVDFEPNQFGGERGGAIAQALRSAPFDEDILSLDVSMLAQAVTDRLTHGICQPGSLKHADCWHLPRLLRLPGERRGEETPAHGLKEPSPVHYSITWLARSSSAGGIVSPSAFAAFRLTTRSNFVGRSTGRSPGIAPLRIRSTYVAAPRNKSG